MTKSLKSTEIADVRDIIFDFIDASISQRNNLVSHKKITQNESDEIVQWENACQEFANKLNLLFLFSSVTADLDAPGQKISGAAKKLKDAVVKLEQSNQFLAIFAVIISIAAKIIIAFSTGNPLGIAEILKDAESFS